MNDWLFIARFCISTQVVYLTALRSHCAFHGFMEWVVGIFDGT